MGVEIGADDDDVLLLVIVSRDWYLQCPLSEHLSGDTRSASVLLLLFLSLPVRCHQHEPLPPLVSDCFDRLVSTSASPLILLRSSSTARIRSFVLQSAHFFSCPPQREQLTLTPPFNIAYTSLQQRKPEGPALHPPSSPPRPEPLSPQFENCSRQTSASPRYRHHSCSTPSEKLSFLFGTAGSYPSRSRVTNRTQPPNQKHRTSAQLIIHLPARSNNSVPSPRSPLN